MSSAPRPDPPYRRITTELRARILAGELKPGDRMPSIRQIADRSGVAVATATRAVAALRAEGLVESRVGSGTVVSARVTPARPDRTGPARTGRPVRRADSSGPPTGSSALSRSTVLRTAIAIADVEGLDAVSMRRVAAELGVGAMSLYRHVANKDDLVTQMADEVFTEAELPDPAPAGWRAKLELVARRQWTLCRRHHWLPRAVSFTRPSLAPNMMDHTEWTMRALDGLGLSTKVQIQEALTLGSLVITAALSVADEVETEQETGVTLARWFDTRRRQVAELMASGRFPLLSAMDDQVVADLEGLFEYSLARHLDGFAVLVDGSRATITE